MTHIIWATCVPRDQDWESDWLQEVFALIPNTQWHDDPSLQLVPMRNAIIVFNIKDSDRLEKLVKYLHAYEDAQIPYGLVHLSDEFYNTYYAMYQYPQCKFVYRNYWHRDLKLPNVRFFALGYKKGLRDAKKDGEHEDRKVPWCFAGNMKNRHPQRLKGLDLLQKHIPNGRVVIEEGDSFSNRVTGLDTRGYRNMLDESIFAYCPPGNVNIDSFRICEAMECGTIPVVLSETLGQKDYWPNLFGNQVLPFVCEESWDLCVNKMETLLQNGEWKQMSKDVYAFWNDYKKRLQHTLLHDVQENFAL